MRTDLAQLYNPVDNPPDPNGQDLTNIVAWMRKLGLPEAVTPIITKEMIDYHGGQYENTDIVFAKPGLPALEWLLYLFMNLPEASLSTLAQYYGFSVPNPIPTYAPPPPPPPPPPVIPAPTRLVGPKIYGTMYQPVANDDSPDGKKYSDERGAFVKHSVATPFGNSVYWEKVG